MPLKLALGMKRTRAERGKSLAFDALTPLSASQVVPPSSVYCQFPPPLLVLTTAMPFSAPASASVIAEPTIVCTNVPG